MDHEEAVTAELLTSLIDRAYELGAADTAGRLRSGTLMELLHQIHAERRSPADDRLEALVRAARFDPLALRAAASWVLVDGRGAEARAAASLLFEASLLANDS